MSSKIKLKILTPDRIVFEEDIDQATLPVLDGQVTILPDHTAYIAALKPGEIMVKIDGKETLMATSSGFIEFQKNMLIVLADTAEEAGKIDLQRAEKAKKRAEADKAVALIEKQMARISVAKKHYSKHGMKID